VLWAQRGGVDGAHCLAHALDCLGDDQVFRRKQRRLFGNAMPHVEAAVVRIWIDGGRFYGVHIAMLIDGSDDPLFAIDHAYGDRVCSFAMDRPPTCHAWYAVLTVFSKKCHRWYAK